MQNEKMMILKMLESGKISTEEASRLLQSVDTGIPPAPTGAPTPPSAPATYTQTPSPAPAPYTSTSYAHNSQQAPRPSSPPPSSSSAPAPHTPPPPSHHYGSQQGQHHSTHSILDDINHKFEEWGPKVRKATATIAEKIAGGVDRLSKSLTEYSPPPSSGGYAPKPRPTSIPVGGLTEKNIEMLVEPGFSELNLSGQNGDVRIKGYNSDKISARISYKAKRAGAHIDLMKLGNKYFLKYEPDDFEVVTIDAYVPERAFSVIRIDGVNANMDCSSLAAGEMAIINANGNLRIAGISAGNLKAESGNGRFIASNIVADSAVLENVNGVMETDELDVAKLKLNNYNGPLSLLMSNFTRHAEYLWNIETGNAKLNMNLPTLPDLGYHIKAHAAMSEIRLGLTGLQFLIHEQSLVEARSVHFDAASRKVKMTVETSNGPLMIN
ncbi:MAG: DUF4097 domain-containing protein [Defluviitaleaceae bacterium]|nr:DUF4097 domain-containing protein [Defluviitaleaceae bacterium]